MAKKLPVCAHNCFDGTAKPDDCWCPPEPVMCIMSLCENGMRRNPNDCSCTLSWCDSESCPDGSKRNLRDCSCPEGSELEPIVCTEDLCWDGNPRSPYDCSCPPHESCKFECERGFIYDSDDHLCKRDCYKPCPEGQEADPRTCKCQPAKVCALEFPCEDQGLVFDTESCSCVSVPPTCNTFVACETIDPDTHLDPYTCSCVKNNEPIKQCEAQACQRGMFWNPEVCECQWVESCNIECAPGQWRDEQHCVCFDLEPQCELACIEPFTLAADCSCQCELMAKCSAGFYFDRKETCSCQKHPGCPETHFEMADGTCMCKQQARCLPGFDWNEKSCSCQQSQTCPNADKISSICAKNGKVLDQETCKCKCDESIKSTCEEAGLRFFDEKKCECTDECPNGAFIASRCEQAGYTFDKKTCKCQKPDQACPGTQKLQERCNNAGFKFDFKTCECLVTQNSNCQDAETKQKRCENAGYLFDRELCDCVKPNCPDPHKMKSKCEQVDLWFDEASCSCKPPKECKQCPNSNFGQNAQTCECLCPEFAQVCDSSWEYWDPEACECSPKQPNCERACESDQHFQMEDCGCTCKMQAGCLEGYTWDDQTCSCVEQRPPCGIRCNSAEGFTLNEDKCACECTKVEKCQAPLSFDRVNTCGCIQQPQCRKMCPPNFVMENRCDCVCHPEFQKPCQSGQTFNKESCQCENNEVEIMCKMYCEPPSILTKDCKCEWPQDYCDLQCKDGEKLDPVSCICVEPLCDKKCRTGQVLDLTTCTCKNPMKRSSP